MARSQRHSETDSTNGSSGVRSPSGEAGEAGARPPDGDSRRGLAGLVARVRSLISAIAENDDDRIQEAILALSRRKRVFAPLALGIGAFALLFNGLKLLISNWRLTLVQIVPAMWIWLAMLDLKIHVLHGKSLTSISGLILVPVGAVIVALTIASFFLNAVFAFAISQPGTPKVRPAVEQARNHWAPIVVSGSIMGIALAIATTVISRSPRPWFVLTLGIVIGAMMISYVAVPSRLIGVKPKRSRRDKLWTSLVAGVLSATVCTPPYLLGRLGLLMLGTKVLFIPGIVFLVVGVTLQAGATGSVRAIKLSASLTPTAPGGEPRQAG